MIKHLSVCLIAFLMIATAGGCSSNQTKYHPGGPYYYISWAHYFSPYRPVNEISKSEADELEHRGYGFYVAFFNEQGRIKSMEKRYQGKIEFKTLCYYDNDVLKKEEVTDANGNVTVTLYDKNGKILKQ